MSEEIVKYFWHEWDKTYRLCTGEEEGLSLWLKGSDVQFKITLWLFEKTVIRNRQFYDFSSIYKNCLRCSHRSAFMKNVQIPVVIWWKKCKFGEKSHRSDPFLSFLQNGGLSNRTPTVHRTWANRVETRRHCSRQRRYSSGRTAPFLCQVNYRLNGQDNIHLLFTYCSLNVH